MGGGGGGRGLRRGRGGVISKIFTNLGGPNLFCLPLGEGHTFIGRTKVLHASVKVDSFIYVNKHTKSLEN